MRLRAACIAFASILLAAGHAPALVHLDQGARVIQGVQILQDAFDDKVFYYLPQFPRLARKEDGQTLEFLAVKYVGNDQVASGGLFHALVEFSLPPELETSVRAQLESEVEGAELRGPVPLLQAARDGEEGVGGFRIVSATLSDSEEGGVTRTLVSSGRAPLTPGSKAAIAAMLEKEGATLLFETLEAPTSDVSVAITAYYEAMVQGYNARVTADMETIYTHFSELSSRKESSEERTLLDEKKSFSKSELRRITDELQRTGDIQVEVLDRTEGLGMDASRMQELLDIVTLRITDLMFDSQTGWSAAPREQPVQTEQVKGCMVCKLATTAAVGMVAGVPGVAAYMVLDRFGEKVSSNQQYVLKERSDIQRNNFTINLGQSTTIRVPVETAGNLGGVYDELKGDPRYFRIVNLDDPAFQKRHVQFQIDGGYVDSFQDTINFVSVNFRKAYPDQPTRTESLVFTHDDVANGRTTKEISFARLGLPEESWQEYEYQVRWSVRDRPTIPVPAGDDDWIRSRDPAVSLVPPFEKRVVEVEADLDSFIDRNVVTAVVEFATPLAGQPKLQRKATFRPLDADNVKAVSIYHDRDEPVGWRVTWQTRDQSFHSSARGLDSEYLYLVAPEPPTDASETP